MKLIRVPLNQKLKMAPHARLIEHLAQLEKLGISLDMDNGPWLAGGSLLRMLFTGEFPSKDIDLDIFIPKGFDTSGLKDDYEFNEAYGRRGFTISAFNGLNGYKYQLIHTQETGIKAILEGFDLTCVQFATDGKVLIGSEEGFYDTDRGEIRKTGSGNHQSTPHRIMKFKEIGLTYQEPEKKDEPEDDIPF